MGQKKSMQALGEVRRSKAQEERRGRLGAVERGA